MKAIRVNETGAPEVMKLEEIEAPEPAPGEVLVKVYAAGVNPVDTYIRSGNYGKVDLPYTPGFDAAGTVEQLGEGVSHFKQGDRVYVAGSISGCYAEYALCKAGQVHPLPDRISFAQGAGVFVPFATAYRALIQKAGAKPGDKVLIHGASGGVGTAAIQIAKAHNIEVTGTAGTEKGLELVKEQGAAHAFNHKEEGYLQRAVEEATGGKGFDIIIEMLANVNLDNDLDVLASEGRVVVVGSRGRIDIDPRKTMAKNSTIMGMTVLATPPDEMKKIHEALIEGMANGTLNPIIGNELPLEQAPKAHEAVLEPGSFGKIILVTD